MCSINFIIDELIHQTIENLLFNCESMPVRFEAWNYIFVTIFIALLQLKDSFFREKLHDS